MSSLKVRVDMYICMYMSIQPRTWDRYPHLWRMVLADTANPLHNLHRRGTCMSLVSHAAGPCLPLECSSTSIYGLCLTSYTSVLSMSLTMSGKTKSVALEGQSAVSGARQEAGRVALCAPFTLGSWMKTHLFSQYNSNVSMYEYMGWRRQISPWRSTTGRSLSMEAFSRNDERSGMYVWYIPLGSAMGCVKEACERAVAGAWKSTPAKFGVINRLLKTRTIALRTMRRTICTIMMSTPRGLERGIDHTQWPRS